MQGFLISTFLFLGITIRNGKTDSEALRLWKIDYNFY